MDVVTGFTSLEKTLIVIIIITVLVFVVYQNTNPQSEHLAVEQTYSPCPVCPICPVCPVCPVCQSCNKTDDKPEQKNVTVKINDNSHPHTPIPPVINQMREYDYRSLSDPLVPPYKRDDSSIPLPIIATRGPPTAFKKIGTLIDKNAENTDKYKFLLLMGRQQYIGSNYYDYYAVDNNSESSLKFDLPNLHKELATDDTVEITQLGKTYSVQIDRSLGFSYNPFVY